MQMTSSLTDYRQQIDQIDQQMIALLKQRIEVVAQVGELKRAEGYKGCFIRSGREADMLRDMYAQFKGSKFNAQAACAIWRQIISASTQHESAMVVATPQADAGRARAYFGDFIPLEVVESAQELLAQLQQNPAALLIMPNYQTHPEWWNYYVQHAPKGCHIFAQIPFLQHEGAPLSYVAAQLEPEPSREDMQLVWSAEGDIKAVESLDQLAPKRWLGSYATPIMLESEKSL